MGKRKLSFYKNDSDIEFVIITGACRSGKTTFAKSLASFDEVEFLDEPWTPMMLPILAYYELFDLELFKSLLSSYLNELANDMILYRRANFRPLDKSSIWQFKKPERIYARLFEVRTRQEAEKILKDKIKILLVLSETTPFIKLFLQSIHNCKMIHLVRNRAAVSDEIMKKQWFGDEQLLSPKNNQPYREFKEERHYYLPWWLAEDKSTWFINASEQERSIFYWDYFVTAGRKSEAELDLELKKKYLEVSFDKYLENKQEMSLQVFQFMKD